MREGFDITGNCHAWEAGLSARVAVELVNPRPLDRFHLGRDRINDTNQDLVRRREVWLREGMMCTGL